MSLSRVVPFTTGGASGAVGPAADVMYVGITVAETGGAVAHVRVRDGQSITGTILETIKLAAGGSQSVYFPFWGKKAAGGVFFEKVAGTIEATVFLA